MKKILALVLALALCLSLASVAGAEGYKDTVKVCVSAERQGSGYYGSSSAVTNYFGRMTMMTLYRLNHDTNVNEPYAAKEGVDVNGDGRTWKFTLKEGIQFHRGGEAYGELKASDVAFTYEFIKPGGEGVQSGAVIRSTALCSYIDSVEVTGEYEVVFHLNSPMFDFLAWANQPILSEKAIAEFGPAEGQDVFSGPYYINFDKVVRGQYWTLTRYDDYFGGLEDHPTKNIEFVILSDANTAAAALQAGEVDALVNNTPAIVLQFQYDPTFTVYSVPSDNVSFIGWNSYDGTGFFDSEDNEDVVKLRQAIGYAIDRDEIVSVIYAVNPAAGSRMDSMFGPATYGYKEMGQHEFNLEKARALMNELGYNENNRLKLRLAHYASYATYGQIIMDQLKDAYIDIELIAVDSSQFGSFLRTGEGWDLFINYYSYASTLAGTMSSGILSTGNSAKTQGWNSAECDARINEIMSKETEEEQVAAFEEFQEWVFNYYPKIVTHSGMQIITAKAEVEGVKVCSTAGDTDFTTMFIKQ